MEVEIQKNIRLHLHVNVLYYKLMMHEILIEVLEIIRIYDIQTDHEAQNYEKYSATRVLLHIIFLNNDGRIKFIKCLVNLNIIIPDFIKIICFYYDVIS